MAGEKKKLSRNDAIFLYAALKHLSTTENQNKIQIYKVRENTPCPGLRENTLHQSTSMPWHNLSSKTQSQYATFDFEVGLV